MALLPILVFWHAAKTSRAAHVSAEVAHVFSLPLAVPSVSLSARKFDGTTHIRCGSGKLHAITSRGIKMLKTARKGIWLPSSASVNDTAWSQLVCQPGFIEDQSPIDTQKLKPLKTVRHTSSECRSEIPGISTSSRRWRQARRFSGTRFVHRTGRTSLDGLPRAYQCLLQATISANCRA